MTYRDEQEALRAKNEALQRQLEDAREEIDHLRAQIEGEPPPAPRRVVREPERPAVRPAFVVAMMLSMLMALVVARAAGMRAHAVCPRYSYTYAGPYYDSSVEPRMSPYASLETFYEPVERTATVIDARGTAPVASGTACTVRVMPVSLARFNCRVEVQCGTVTPYGQPRTGYTQCALTAGMPVSAHDLAGSATDSDARLDMDLNLNSLVISDDEPMNGYAIKLALDHVDQ